MSASERVVFQVDAIGNFSNVIGEVNKLQSRLQSLKLPSNLNTKFESSLKDIMNKYEQFQTLASKGVRTKGDFSKLNSSAKDFENSLRSLKKELNGVTEQKLRVQVDNLPEVKALEQEIKRLQKTYTELNSLGTNKIQGIFGADETQKIRTIVGESKKLKPALENAFAAIKTGNIDDGLKALDEFEKDLNRINGGALNVFQKANPTRKADIQKYINEARRELILMGGDASEAKAKLEQLKADRFTQMASGISTARAQLDNLGDSASKTTREILNTARATQNMESQLTGLQTQANYFFGLQNMIQLFRRGLSDTIQTVRDLDKAMTDTAVVTDMTVSDLWAQLPDYTKLANKLGATTQGAYETMTLYYQQGLNKEETFEIGEETMKMARIAGLDYAQTTNMMTAALRGFNMELNQTSAKRVNDVYSELAAITASDTRELGLAMERTASIAHSANMDFGNTTAFLAQMIETTREAPENLGTAMKTIIARFQELKENPYQISEVEGEEVDFNRVDKALKSIGVDLMDNRDKFRDLDDVFLDISSKWDGLSQTQQRYVATIAAGARQQSRFLAMVQNYDRLKELTDAAANSEGASDVQFSKTLDSMEAKLNKLNNAWDQFAMGITNNNLIKKGTGALVKILDVVNKFETGVEHLGDKIGGVFGDIFKSITSFTGLLLGFKGLGKLTDIGIGMLGGMLGMGKGVGAGMFGGMSGIRQSTNMAQAKAISNPIVTAINRLSEAILKKPVEQDNENIKGVGRQEFKNRNQQLRDMTMSVEGKGRDKKMTAKRFSVKDFGGVFEDLNREEQAALYRGSKGTREAIQKSFSEGVAKLNVSDEATHAAERFYTDLDYAMANGSHQVQSGLTKAFDPVKLGRAIGGDAGKEIEKAALERRKNIIKQGQQLGFNGQQELKKYWQSREADLYGGKIKLDDGEMKANTSRLSGMTSAVNGLGSSFMQLGMTMQSIGFEKLGGAISIAGSSLLSMGMMAETASHGLKVLKTEAAGVYSVIAGAAPALAIAGGVLAAAFVGYKIKQKQIKEIRKSGKEVVDTYEETTKSVQENLNKLDKIQPDWDKWAAGVDANGNNVSLGTEEYQDYKKAVKDIIQMQPSLIKGYNAEGEAIIDNQRALAEAQKLEEKRQEDATKKYLDNGQKIIDRRNSTKRWQKGQENKVDTANLARGAGITAAYASQKSTIEKDAQAAANAIKKIDGSEEVLTKWGVTFDEFGNITQHGINILRQHGGDIQNELSKMFENPTEAQQKLLNNSNDTIAQLGQDFKGIEDVSKETFDALKVYATEQGAFKGLDENLVAPYQNALKNISEQDLTWNQSKKAVDELTKKYQNLGGHLGDFNEIQQKVQEAQDQFGKDLNMNAYQSAVSDATKDMDGWIIELRSSSDEANHILADWLENQKATFKNISESALSLGEAFNVHSGAIAAANAAYENWSKQNEGGDYYTAAEGFKKMVDEVNDGVDDLGKGSKQWWSAMTSILGEDYVFDHGKKEIEGHMKTIQGFFEDGKKGAQNFMAYLDSETIQGKKLDSNFFKKGETIGDYIQQTEKGLNFDKLGDLSPEQLSSLIKTSGMAEEAFTAAMNKAQQFYDIQAGDVDKMLTAIATGESTVLGSSGQKYMRESEFRQEGIEATGDANQVKEYQKQLANMGVTFMKSASEISKQEMSGWIKDWGISTGQQGKLNQTTTDAFIKYFDKMGYNKDEISQLYETAGNLITDRNKVDYNEAYQTATESNADPSVRAATSIDSNVSSILSTVQSIAGAMGMLTSQDKATIDKTATELTKTANDIIKGKTEISNRDAQAQAQNNIDSLESTKAMLEAGMSNYDKNSDEYKEYASSLKLVEEAIKQNQQVIDTAKANLETLIQNREAADKTVEESKSKELNTAYGDTAGEDKHLNVDKLDTLITSVQQNVNGAKEQSNVIGQYLQNSVKALADNGANGKQIAESMRTAAKEMAEKGMKPEDITSALNQAYGTHLEKGDVTAEGNITAKLNQEELQAQLSNLQADITANITQVTVGGAAASGQNNPNSAFHRTGTMARGSRKGYTISGRPTLMGEEGEEVVWEPKRNEAYIVGSNGPQFGNISKNAVVWNAQQTKKIKKNSKTTGALGTGARGITPIGTMKGGNAGGGGGGMTIPGTFDINATANVQEVTPPTEPPEIPVKGKLEVEGSEKGGLLNKIKSLMGGDKKGGPSIKVTAEATKVNVGEQAKTIKVTGDITKLNNEAGNVKDIKATARVTKVTKSGTVTGEPVKVKATAVVSGKASGTASTATVKTKADNAAQKDINSIKHKGTVLIKTKADNAAQRAINNIKGKDVTIHIKPSFEGTWTKNATVHVNHDAKGQNNYIAHRTAPSFGSAASGRGGKLGPKGKGGLTLTGEEGFEIAWLPSENRSMILGAKGPQMLMLPSDAIVWTHEQSKKILQKHQSIAAGSMWRGGATRDWGSSGGSSKGSTKGSTKGSKKSSKKKSGKKGKDKDKKNTAAAAKVIQTAGKINLWWWNMTKKVEATQRRIDKAAKAFEKTIGQIGVTISSLQKFITNYRTPLNLQIGYNREMRDKADSEFKVLNYGNKSVDKKVKKAQKKVNKAQKKYNKKKTKSNKKALDKAKKQLNSAKTGLNYETISYDVTEKKTTKSKKGKKKTTSKKVTKKSRINLAPYITFDTESGAYQVDYQKINKTFGKNKSKANAVGEAAKKKIEDLQSKRNTAEDNMIKAQEALEELGKKVSETFFQWENELTEVYNLTQRISNLTSFADRFDSQIEMALSALSAGFGDTVSSIVDAQTVLSRKNQTIQDQVKVQQQMIDARGRELDRMLSSEDEQALINKFTAMTEAQSGGKEAREANIQFAKDRKAIADLALKYVNITGKQLDGSVQYEINWQAFEDARYNADTSMSDKTYEQVKKYLDDLGSAATEFNESIKTQSDFIEQTYDALKEYQDYIVSFEDTIIKGVEEQVEKETQNAKQISDSIRDGLKDLLDEVKNKLDERRKQEDNLKTERDIAQKQQRLAALRADTSGGHQVEIAQLEKEIAEAQQSYGRTLEDQMLDRLQQQADEAAKQRERQIELAETANQISEDSNRELVNLWLKDPVKYREELKAAWLESQNFDEAGAAGQASLLNQWKSVYSELITAIKQSGFNSENGIFKPTADNAQTLVNFINQLTNGEEWANITARNTKTIDDYEKTAENAKLLKEEFKLTADILKQHGWTAGALIGDPSNPIFSGQELKNAGYTAGELKEGGLNSVKQLREAGFNAQEVKEAGFNNINDYINQYSWSDIGKVFTPQDFKDNNISYAAAVQGFGNSDSSLQKLSTVGYDEASKELIKRQQEAAARRDRKAKENLYRQAISDAASNKKIGKDEFIKVKEIANAAGHAAGKYMADLAATSGLTWKQVINAAKAAGFSRYSMAKTFTGSTFIKAYESIYGKGSYQRNRKSKEGSAYGKYAKGGLANYTGPAWLDGTPSKPELVLNPTDTKNFLALKDVLSNALSSTKSIENTYGGDTSYEININVDHLNNDYDVDKVAERVKRIIVKDAGYRNVTQVRNFR